MGFAVSSSAGHLAVKAATSAPMPWKAASSSMDSSSHLPHFLLCLRRKAAATHRLANYAMAIPGSQGVRVCGGAHSVLSTSKQTACGAKASNKLQCREW